MDPKSTLPDELYHQDTDLQIIGVLFRSLKTPFFLDVGAEKGGFARALFRMGFEKGVLFEPLPSHLTHLRSLFENSAATILPYAIDSEDRMASFNIACDETGAELNYFHSLNKVSDHEFFKHSRTVETRCRSLESLLASGEIPAEIGVLKIDTEGNDLRVLQGIGALRPEMVVCEYVPPSVYPDWQLSFANNLIPEARKLGYTHLVAIQRTHGNDVESVRLDPEGFTADDWGNLVFIRQDLFEAAADALRGWMTGHADRYHGESAVRVIHDDHYGAGFRDWLTCQMKGFSRSRERSVALDVGAHEGVFFKPLLDADLITSLVLFEPHPGNAARLRDGFSDKRVKVEEMAVAVASGTVEFRFGEDTATGSVLAPRGHTPAATEKRTVPMIRLDDYASANGLLDKINVLKIDTQGADLAVLQGAERLLRESQPVLVVEMIFAPLYEGQGDSSTLISWLASRGYRLAGFFDEHFSREGWLAWTDACFLPVSRITDYNPPFMQRGSNTAAADGRRKRRKRGLAGWIGKITAN